MMKTIWYHKYEIQESTWEWKEVPSLLIVKINNMKLATLYIYILIYGSKQAPSKF